MKFGINIFPTATSMAVDVLAKAAEERGFDSIWVAEHPHIPVERESRFPGSRDTRLPEYYWHCLDPFVALSLAAAATTELKLATGICLVTEREPIVLAKQVATLDLLSGGRFLFGIGGGWLAEEMEALGTPFKQRWQVSEQRVAAMKRLWQDAEAEYHSEFVEIPRTLSYPKPLQKPHPPVLIAANSTWARQRVVDWADGWLPARTLTGRIAEDLQDLRERAQRAGRDPDSIETSLFGAEVEELDDYERAGVARCVFRTPSAPAEQVMPELDRLARVIAGRR